MSKAPQAHPSPRAALGTTRTRGGSVSSLADWWVNARVKRLRTHLKEDQ